MILSHFSSGKLGWPKGGKKRNSGFSRKTTISSALLIR